MSCPDYSADPPADDSQAEPETAAEAETAQPTADCPGFAASRWYCARELMANSSRARVSQVQVREQNLIEGMKCPSARWATLPSARHVAATSSGDAPTIPSATSLRTTSRSRKSVRSAAARLVEKTLKSGIFLECPNKKKGAEEEGGPAKRGKKAAEPEPGAAIVCHYSKRIGDAPPPPTADTHGPVIEKPDANRSCSRPEFMGGCEAKYPQWQHSRRMLSPVSA